MPFTSSFKQIDPSHRLRITIEQIGQNPHAGFGDNHAPTSDVRVMGYLYNDSDFRNWNFDPVVDRSIFGEDTYNPANFSFDLAPHTNMVFISHVFTVDHNANGTKTVNFTVRYGDTQISTFDGPQQLGDNLVLDRIGKLPNAPGVVTFVDVTSSTVTARWAACSDDNGSPIKTYQLKWTKEPLPGIAGQGLEKTSSANNLSRKVTGLTPGRTYNFTVRCQNGIGWSVWTPETTVVTERSGLIRVNGKWTAATASVRHNGKWLDAVPWVRKDGTWHRVT
jgi:hypothetical protein